jgi:hypothetical protein
MIAKEYSITPKMYKRTGVYGLWKLNNSYRMEDGKLYVVLYHPELDLKNIEDLGGVRPNEGNIDYVITTRLKKKEFYFDSPSS